MSVPDDGVLESLKDVTVALVKAWYKRGYTDGQVEGKRASARLVEAYDAKFSHMMTILNGVHSTVDVQ